MQIDAPPLLEYPQRARVLEAARASTDAVDAAERSPFDLLAELGADGLTSLGRTGALTPMAAVVFDLATQCVATAFSLWGHRMTVTYHDAVGAIPPAGLVDATVAGASAMAPAFKSEAGIGRITVAARAVEGGLLLDGSLPWASNLVPGAVVVMPVLREDGTAAIVRTGPSAPGFTAHRMSGLLALDATASSALTLEGVYVPERDVLTDDVPGFLAAVSGTFLLLQSSFCLGLSAAALDSAADHLGGVNTVFADDARSVQDEYLRLREELLARSEDPASHLTRELALLRLDAGRLAGTATRLEAALVGGRGYRAASPTARRLREAAFLPVQSPTEGHLRWLLRP